MGAEEHGGHSHHGRSSLTLALALTLGYAALEAAAGVWSGSLALISDAGPLWGDRIALSAHLSVADLSKWEEILPAAAAMVQRRYGIGHVTLQPEPSVRTLKRLTPRP